MDSKVIVKGFKERFGAIIANGQGTMQGQIFRMAHLGYFDFADMFGIIAGLELILRANGHRIAGKELELGKGVAAVQRVYEAAQTKKANA
jgi:aspartate aminotransferase-like enzyme